MQETNQPQANTNKKILLVIPKLKIDQARQLALKKIAKKYHAPGFRKGKAPISMVVDKITTKELIDYILKLTLPEAYQKAISLQKLMPVTQPRFKIIEIKPDSNWQIEAEFGLMPSIDIPNANIVKKIKQIKKEYLNKLKTEQDKNKKTRQQSDRQRLFIYIVNKLQENYQPNISPLLLEEKLQIELDKLHIVLKQMGLTFNQYLKRLRLTQEALIEKMAHDLQIRLQKSAIIEKLKMIRQNQVKENEQPTINPDSSKNSNNKEEPQREAEFKNIENWLHNL